MGAMSDTAWRGSRSGGAYLCHAVESKRPICGQRLASVDTCCRHELCPRCLTRAGEPAGWADHAERVVAAVRWCADTLPACSVLAVVHGPRSGLAETTTAHIHDVPVVIERYPDNRYAWEVHATYEVQGEQPWMRGPRTAASIAWCPSCGYHRDSGQPDNMEGAVASAEARVIRHVEEALRSFAWAGGPWLDQWMRRRREAAPKRQGTPRSPEKPST